MDRLKTVSSFVLLKSNDGRPSIIHNQNFKTSNRGQNTTIILHNATTIEFENKQQDLLILNTLNVSIYPVLTFITRD